MWLFNSSQISENTKLWDTLHLPSFLSLHFFSATYRSAYGNDVLSKNMKYSKIEKQGNKAHQQILQYIYQRSESNKKSGFTAVMTVGACKLHFRCAHQRVSLKVAWGSWWAKRWDECTTHSFIYGNPSGHLTDHFDVKKTAVALGL